MRLEEFRFSSRVFLVLLLCLSVFLQVLGAPVSFHNLNGSADPREFSALEGVSLLSVASQYSTIVVSTASLMPFRNLPHLLEPVAIFHPPILNAFYLRFP
jgi:hypothetical protein